MILGCVVTQCEEKRARLGWGFWPDGKNGQAQDMQTTFSSSARDLESMFGDVAPELHNVALGLGGNSLRNLERQ